MGWINRMGTWGEKINLWLKACFPNTFEHWQTHCSPARSSSRIQVQDNLSDVKVATVLALESDVSSLLAGWAGQLLRSSYCVNAGCAAQGVLTEEYIERCSISRSVSNANLHVGDSEFEFLPWVDSDRSEGTLLLEVNLDPWVVVVVGAKELVIRRVVGCPTIKQVGLGTARLQVVGGHHSRLGCKLKREIVIRPRVSIHGENLKPTMIPNITIISKAPVGKEKKSVS